MVPRLPSLSRSTQTLVKQQSEDQNLEKLKQVPKNGDFLKNGSKESLIIQKKTLKKPLKLRNSQGVQSVDISFLKEDSLKNTKTLDLEVANLLELLPFKKKGYGQFFKEGHFQNRRIRGLLDRTLKKRDSHYLP